MATNRLLSENGQLLPNVVIDTLVAKEHCSTT